MQIRLPDFIDFHINRKEILHFKGDNVVQKDDVRVEVVFKKESLHIRLSADETPVRYIKLRWNHTEQDKPTETVKVYGDVWERAYSDMEWHGIYPHRCMPWVCAFSNGSDLNLDYSNRFTHCFGVKVRPNALCFWQYDGKGVNLFMDVRCGGEGVVLQGRTLDVCDVLFAEYNGKSAFLSLKDFYFKLCDDALLPDHKVYGNNNWYYAYGRSSDEEILKDTDILIQQTKDLKNPPYMVVDDCWSENSCDGPWNRLRATFSDMKVLAEKIKEKGAKPGIWFRPLSDSKHTVNLCRMSWDDRYLDPSHPAVLEYISKTVRMLSKEWGYKLIKHDFSTHDIVGGWGCCRTFELATEECHFYDKSKTTAEIIIALYKTIYEAAEKDTLILGCNVIGHLAAGLHHINRTGDDTSGRNWDRTRKLGINTLAFRMLHHGAFYEADADCVGLTKAVPWELNRRWLEILSKSGTPLFVSPSPDVLNDEIYADLKAAYAVNSEQKDVLEPMDWMENICPEIWRLNGDIVTFNWYPEDGVDSFPPRDFEC